MRYVYGVLSLLFVLFAYFQFNDPDSLRWILLYGFAAIIMGLATFGIKNKFIIYLGYVVFGTGFIFLAPSFFEWLTAGQAQNLMERMDNSKMYIEESREFLGLGICLLCNSLLWIKSGHDKKPI